MNRAGARRHGRAASRSATSGAPLPTIEATITSVGADGDGVTATDPPFYVPFTLPGERGRVRTVARHGNGYLGVAEDWTAVSPDRVLAPCAHFGACGGCVLQHWDLPAYQAWKTGLLAAALTRAGLPIPPPAPLAASPPAARRRIDLAVRRIGGTLTLGLHRHRAHEIVDLAACAVLHSTLASLLAPLRGVLRDLHAVRRQAAAVVNLLDNGPDLLLRTDAEPTLADRAALTGFARTHGLPRIAWALGDGPTEPICQLRRPVATLGGVAVTPPPGAFLQATAQGETAIVAAVCAGLPERLPPRARIAELYAGCGTLTFALARHARVAAWEGDAAAAGAARDAANHAGLAGRVNLTQRDLARQPLQPAELAGFAAVVLDPPYAGAAAQIGAIAAAAVPAVIYVSCNPAALARDAAVLRGAGYRLAAATPIDQFLWSARLESVCVFRRDRG